MFTSEAVTRGVRVRVQSKYDPKRSSPAAGQWFFPYTITITNEGDETVQLMTRHWLITDGNNKVHEVRGPGVVGDVLPGPAPLHAVRVQQGDAPSLRSVTLPAWPLPAFRSAAWSVVPPLRAGDGPPLSSSRVQASSPVAPGLSCRLLRKPTGTPSPPLPDSAPGWTPGLARTALGRAG